MKIETFILHADDDDVLANERKRVMRCLLQRMLKLARPPWQYVLERHDNPPPLTPEEIESVHTKLKAGAEAYRRGVETPQETGEDRERAAAMETFADLIIDCYLEMKQGNGKD